MADYDVPLSPAEKGRIVSDFLLHAPPGEFREVLNDVRLLLNDDAILKEHASSCFPQYAKDQLTPVRIEGSDHPCLITEFNDLGAGRFYDPRSKQSFKYDFLREEASEYEPWTPESIAEPWRASLEETLTAYVKEHNPNGVCSVFASHQNGNITLNACIEDHQFQPKNFWNGRWRSIWTVTFTPTSGTAELSGIIKVQVHYYEDGNVQLVSSKDIKKTLNISGQQETAKEIIHLIKDAENEYQEAIRDNYQTMSDTTFKALRRPLPVTRSKIEWNKIMSYRIGSELPKHNS